MFFLVLGSLVLLKQDLETLKAFYNTNLITSKMAEMYQNSNTMIQVKNFNYVPKINSLVLYNADVLTIEKMRKILGIFQQEQESEKTSDSVSENQPEETNFISDEDLLSNPFFTTLTPLN